jgi:hypothetical protein
VVLRCARSQTEHPTQRRDGPVLIANCLISVGVAA